MSTKDILVLAPRTCVCKLFENAVFADGLKLRILR